MIFYVDFLSIEFTKKNEIKGGKTEIEIKKVISLAGGKKVGVERMAEREGEDELHPITGHNDTEFFQSLIDFASSSFLGSFHANRHATLNSNGAWVEVKMFSICNPT
jgi:hypothetical protein